MTLQLCTKIAAYLAAAFGVQAQDAKPNIPATLNQWGHLLISGGGDLVPARGHHFLQLGGLDASFVRVSPTDSNSASKLTMYQYKLLVDLDAH